MSGKRISVIVPARNEAAALPGTLSAIIAAASAFSKPPAHDFHLRDSSVEVFAVDNDSDDDTAALIDGFAERFGVTRLHVARRKAAAARNEGASNATSSIFVFVDADTRIPTDSFAKIADYARNGFDAGIFRLADGDDCGLRAWCWWTYWEHVRRLPLAHAKAMPAFMFCTRLAFEEFGPFDETRVIAEEWPILARLYAARPHRLVYDRKTTALTSSRRMEKQLFGYTRLYAKYLWAILHESGRIAGYGDGIR
ncbi:MAG: glycosyltransferase [Candidatus Sumerlaeota bacterium]